jgi:hypothetical protein
MAPGVREMYRKAEEVYRPDWAAVGREQKLLEGSR